MEIKRRNKWRLLFYVLLGVNMIGLIFIVLLSGLFSPSPLYKLEEMQQAGHATFTISASKEDLNQTMNSYLHKLSKFQKMDYYVRLEEDVKLAGTMKAFDRDIQLEIRFDPIVLDNGDLLLQTKSMHIGALPIPVSRVLDYVKKKYPLPKWVTIQPKEERIYVTLTQMKTKSDFKVKVLRFNLLEDELEFELVVPNG